MRVHRFGSQFKEKTSREMHSASESMHMRSAAGFFFYFLFNAAVFFGWTWVKETPSHQTQTAIQSLAQSVSTQSLHYCTQLFMQKTDEMSSSAA